MKTSRKGYGIAFGVILSVGGASPDLLGPPGGTICYGETFDIGVSIEIDEACLISLGANTHSFDQNQRYVPLTVGNPWGAQGGTWATG